MDIDDINPDSETTIKVGAVASTGESCEEFYPPPCCMIIFGASGDLTRRKLLPALYRLTKNKILSDKFFVIGAARTEMDDNGFRHMMEGSLKEMKDFDAKAWNEFSKRLFYRKIDYGKDTLEDIKKLLDEKEEQFGTGRNRLFYLATPPSAYAGIIETLGSRGLSKGEKSWSRIVIEKPYGHDLESAKRLEEVVLKNFDEQQVYRIDHYLGKETVQNIMMLRFANLILEPIWNRRYIDHVQITVAESMGIEGRAGYYEQAGVLRDMFQNHILQVLAFIAMEPPSIYESELVRDERVKVFRALRPIDTNKLNESLVIGQYAAGEVGGKAAQGYIEEKGVAKGSMVPTFATLKVFVDNWRWQDVPFYLRSGKRLSKKFSQVTIQFKGVPHQMFRETIGKEIGPNALILRIQPDERVQLRFHTKNPGSKVCLRDVLMDFPYMQGYTGIELSDYERVLIDCMLGDKMLFVRRDGMELAWSFLTPILKAAERGRLRPEVDLYKAGSYGPFEADKLLQKDGRQWVNL